MLEFLQILLGLRLRSNKRAKHDQPSAPEKSSSGSGYWPFSSLVSDQRPTIHSPGRLNIYNPILDADAKEAGLMPQDVEFDIECPNLKQWEDVVFWGVNSSGESLKIQLKWRPWAQKVTISATMVYEDGQGNSYEYKENKVGPVTRYQKDGRLKEYSIGNLSIEIISPFRKYRIKFRGFLIRRCEAITDANANDQGPNPAPIGPNHNSFSRQNSIIDGEMIFAKFRMLWFPVSRPFDFLTDHNSLFTASELTKCLDPKSHPVDSPEHGEGEQPSIANLIDYYHEDRYEQLGNMKGTIELEGQSSPTEVYLWGGRAKRFIPQPTVVDGQMRPPMNNRRKFIRVYGYNKKGMAFHVGLIKQGAKTNLRSRYGHIYWGLRCCHALKDLSLTSQQIEDIAYGIGLHLDCKCVNNGNNGNYEKNFCPNDDCQTVKFNFKAYDRDYDAKIMLGTRTRNGVHDLLIKGYEGRAMVIVDDEAQDIVVDGFVDHIDMSPIPDESSNKNKKKKECRRQTVLFAEDLATKTEFTGGKGSSLAHLIKMTSDIDQNGRLRPAAEFQVPQGIIVTTEAYKLFLETYDLVAAQIDQLERLTWSTTNEQRIREACEQVVDAINQVELPIESQAEVVIRLKYLFGNDFRDKLFAVRSSGCQEDSAEMSAAGQMASFLGVQGAEEIFRSIVSCWASQFSYTAVMHKKNYGQLINVPMAVVIQEMVDADSAGVMFTCDPVTGNPRNIVITANYGLGESVVAAMTDPDTIRLSVNYDRLNKQEYVEGIESVTMGKKQRAIKLNGRGGGGTRDVYLVSSQDVSCISEKTAIKMGRISKEIERYFDEGPRDIEWAVKKSEETGEERIYILQCRPITNLEMFSDFEIEHELDTGLPSEQEIYSRANVGEVFPTTVSPLTITFTCQMWAVSMFQQVKKWEGWDRGFYTPYIPMFGLVQNHLFMNLKNVFFNAEDSSSLFSKATMISLFGHPIDNKELREDTTLRLGPQTLWVKCRRFIYSFPRWIAAPKYFERVQYWFYDFQVLSDSDKAETKTSADILSTIIGKIKYCYHPILVHGDCSWASSFYNLIVLSILAARKKDLTTSIFADFGRLLSVCNQVVSAEVPDQLKQIAKSIEDPEQFKSMEDNEALEWLVEQQATCGKLFRQFMHEHGHRGYNEFDVAAKPWRDDPIPVIRSLKALLMGDHSHLFKPKLQPTDDEILDSLETELGFFHRFLLKHFALKLCRDAVGRREQSKSFFIWTVDRFRAAMRVLGERMEAEGRIPAKELLPFLTFDELQELVNHRNPLILAKAKHRQRLHKKIEALQFGEFTLGPDMRPKSRGQFDNAYMMKKLSAQNGDEVTVKGTPLCPGQVRARVCVAPILDDAKDIRPGDILITPSTDIGWSPYFPLLSGLATEIGGLVSHGAVIAREYGLPCLIGAEGACQMFRTGDHALLDSKVGFITKVDPPSAPPTPSTQSSSNPLSSSHIPMAPT